MRIRHGGWAWIGLTAYIIAVDAWLIRHNHDTMSIVFGDAILNPRKSKLIITLWVLITLHLFANILHIPEEWTKYDPIGWLANRIRAV